MGPIAETPNRAHRAPRTIRRVLLVEDSMLIALDAEEALKAAGITEVAVAANVAAALAQIDEAMPDFALLDFNLGGESSEAVAEVLDAAGVAYCFATGYGDAIGNTRTIPPCGILKKPYSQAHIAAVLDLAAGRALR